MIAFNCNKINKARNVNINNVNNINFSKYDDVFLNSIAECFDRYFYRKIHANKDFNLYIH